MDTTIGDETVCLCGREVVSRVCDGRAWICQRLLRGKVLNDGYTDMLAAPTKSYKTFGDV